MVKIRSTEDWTLNYFLIFLVFAVVNLLLAIFALSLYFQIPFLSLSELAGAIGSLALSSILAFMYVKINQTQSEQKDLLDSQKVIMRQQQNILEAELRPHLSINKVKLYQYKTSPDSVEQLDNLNKNVDENFENWTGEKLTVSLDNSGKSVGINICIGGYIRILDEDINDIAVLNRPLNQSDKIVSVNTGYDSTQLFGTFRDNLDVGQTEEFTTPIVFILEMENGEQVSVPSGVVLDFLRQHDVSVVDYCLWVEYTDLNDKPYKVPMMDIKLDLTEEKSVREIIGDSIIYTSQEYIDEFYPNTSLSIESIDS